MKMGLKVYNMEPNYEYMTPLETEMKICAKYLHCTHDKFCRLPNDEKLKWLLYEEMKIGRMEYRNKKQELETKKQEQDHKIRRVRELK